MAFHEFEQPAQIVGLGVRVENGDLEPQPLGGGGAAEDGRAVVEEAAAQRGDGGGRCPGGAEEDGADGGAGVELEAGAGLDEVGEVLGGRADVVDEVAEAAPAECPQGDGDLEDVGAAGGAEGAAEQVGQPRFGVVVGVEVLGLVGQRGEGGAVRDGEEAERRPAASRVCAGRGRR